jgi:hypothetical protein
VKVGDSRVARHWSDSITSRAVVLTEECDDSIFLDESLRCANSGSGNSSLIGDQEFQVLTIHATRRVDFLYG